ncbi:MFS transporter [Sphingomonas koreensis]|uniref:spinster family MFS transporter n=1 Tax=Sphingomonas koreensis TaxID=93064 RepID=UPI00082EF22C|nr:MFS transporter [Sphingomonas koreensis]PJI88754.1 sugar phosphate permease [Sphingomonas koreensis]RSU63636.1 MFS transporter [Sphingomonas koreensis]RSU69276.1 MFS transporter [Sphingomonas koreensis]
MNASEGAPARQSTPGYRGVVLAMLLLVYTFNFLDRQILGILAVPIKADLGLTDAEFGAIGGLAFALLYSILGVPLAYLADRTSRSAVIAGSLAVWSAFTALCGTATGYWHLFLYRLGVGVGEAGGVAPSYALIADYFPPEKRARALAIYSLGIPVGLAGGTLLGAYIAALVDWRTAFIVMGVAGIVLAPIFKYMVRDLPRPAAAAKATPVSGVFPILAKKPAFWLMAFAASFSSLCGYGLALWTPSILMRSFGFDLITTGQFMGSILLVGGVAGVFAGGWFADRLGTKDRGWYVKLPAIAWAITMPTFAFGLLSPSSTLAWVLLLIPNALNILWLGPVTTAIQHLVPREMRATASASFLLINNLVGLGAGPLLMGALSDALKSSYGIESLRYAAVGCLIFYGIAAALMLLAVKPLRRGWVDDVTG